MRGRAADLIAELREPPPSLDRDECEEAAALLAWMDDGHFTFLGFARVRAGDATTARIACAGSRAPGSGILRESAGRRAAERGEAVVARERARARAASARSHQGQQPIDRPPARLPRLRRGQAVRAGRGGRRRAALPRALHDGGVPRGRGRDPGGAAQGRGGRRARRASRPPATPRRRWWRSSTPTRATSCSRSPRTSCSSSPWASWPSASASACASSPVATPLERFVSCLVFLPRDRFHTRNRERVQEILAEAFDAESVDFELRLSESVLVRIHFTVRLRPGHVPDYDPAEIEARIVEATGSWTDELREALLAGGRRGAGHRRCTAATATRSRPATATTGSPARRSSTSGGSSAWPTASSSRSACTTRSRRPRARCAASCTAAASR